MAYLELSDAANPAERAKICLQKCAYRCATSKLL